MKTTSKLIIFIFALLALSASAHAQSPREQLSQLTAQLQQTPTDNALREKIVKLAATFKPAPAIPEEARKHFVEGAVIKKAAKNPAQAALAAQSFSEALKVAPWWADAYYNLGVTQEQAENYDAAEKAFNFYLLSNASATEKREVQDLIYALAAKRKLAAAEAASASAAAAATQAAAAMATANRLEGTWVQYSEGYDNMKARLILSIKQDAGRIWHVVGTVSIKQGGGIWQPAQPMGSVFANVREVQLKGSDLQFISDHAMQMSRDVILYAPVRYTATVASDGRTIKFTGVPIPLPSSEAARWGKWIVFAPQNKGVDPEVYEKE